LQLFLVIEKETKSNIMESAKMRLTGQEKPEEICRLPGVCGNDSDDVCR
jgi:hypothetical protein